MIAQPQVITVNGAATCPVTADQATLLFLAEGTGATVGQAIRAHAEEVQRVVQSLTSAAARRRRIFTVARPLSWRRTRPGLPAMPRASRPRIA